VAKVEKALFQRSHSETGEHFLGPGYIKALPLGKTTLKKNSQTKLKENESLFPRTIL
jgi:hypothetical protein